MEQLRLKCEDCNTEYNKPITFKEYSETEKHTHFFFKRCLKYCDKCRRVRERKMLIEGLPKVIEALSKP